MPSVVAGSVGPLSLCLLIASRRAAVMSTVRMLKVPPYTESVLYYSTSVRILHQ